MVGISAATQTNGESPLLGAPGGLIRILVSRAMGPAGVRDDNEKKEKWGEGKTVSVGYKSFEQNSRRKEIRAGMELENKEI